MPRDEREEENGPSTPERSDEVFIDAVSGAGGATTEEVADRVGCDRRTARDRLDELEEAGQVEKREIENSLFWTTKSQSG